MLRVVSQNLNGIRSAARKGWFPWAATLGADAICVQEVRAQLSDMDDTMQAIGPAVGRFHLAERRGYSGVGIYTPHTPPAPPPKNACNASSSSWKPSPATCRN